MNIFFLRHASAGLRRPNPALDLKRPLDKEGKQHCLRLAHILNALKISFDLVVSSPLKRSLQTAQFVATETSYEAEIATSQSLAPAATLADFQRLLSETSGRENVLLVGHNPNLQLFLGAMLMPHIHTSANSTGVNGAAANGAAANRAGRPPFPQVRLRKGSIARVSLARGPATLMSVLDPRVVRALYATSTKSSRPKTSRK